MWRLAVRNLMAHPRRLIGTCAAVVLGVAFLAGTLVFSDTMRASFNDVFAAANAGTDAIVQGKHSVSSARGQQSSPVPESLVATLQGVPQVKTAVPGVQGFGTILGADSQPIGGDGPPTVASNWVGDSSANPYRIVQGHAPTRAGEMVINADAAAKGSLSVGSKTELLTPDPIPMTVVGIVNFGNAGGLGGTSYAGLTLTQAQQLFGKPGSVDAIMLQANPGTSQEQLVAAVKPLLPANVEAITGEQKTQTDTERIQSGFLNYFTTFLLIFAVIALVVATFSIYNTLTVIVAQRTRESALLRALGSTKRQVIASVTGEAVLIGVLSAAIGVGAGIALAAGLHALLAAVGFGLPAGGLTMTMPSLVWPFVVGVVVTVVASLVPALRASRVRPVEALREVAVDTSDQSSNRRAFGWMLAILGLLTLSTLALSGDEVFLWRAGVGGAAIFVGFLLLAPTLVPPVISVLGWPIRMSRGIAGSLATRNAARNPRRTANTAIALLLGVCVVTLFTIFASSTKSSIDASVAGTLKAQLVMSNNGFSGAGYSPAMVKQIDQLPDVAAAVTFSRGTVLVAGEQLDVTVTDPQELGNVLTLAGKGSADGLQQDSIAVSATTAGTHALTLGSSLTVGMPDGTALPMTVGMIYDDEPSLGPAVVPRDVYSQHVRQMAIDSVLISTASGVPVDQAQASVQHVADSFHAGSVQTKSEYIKSAAGQIDQLLTIIYALLALAILIALMGITNTLSLSIYERTRELGLLRAVGQTRSQLRSMVRWESVLIAVFGTVTGLVLGVILGWACIRALQASQPIAAFSLPIAQLLVVGLVGMGVGVVAGWRPARRASKLDILRAISVE